VSESIRAVQWRLLWLTCIAACASTAEPAPMQQAAVVPASKPMVPDGVAPAERDTARLTVVGVIHQDGQRVCDARGHETWVDLHYVVGFTPLVLEEATSPAVAALHRRPAIVVGRVQAPPSSTAVPSAGECPAYQMRSDWVLTAEGVRIPRGPRAAEGVAVERAAPFEGLKVARAGDMLTLALTNPFDVPLEGELVLTVHYEGCFGKPGADVRSSTRPDPLPPGETWQVEAPALLHDAAGQPGRQLFRAHSIEVRAAGKGIAFDLDAAFHELGAQGVACPRERATPKPSP
jgi:hypothetical protein